MPREFNVPHFYRSRGIGAVKQARRAQDPRKKDLSPSVLDFGPVRFKIARHFGFCFGVENAIEIAYRALEENPDKAIFLLSEMIHNPEVNADLKRRGVRFLMDTSGLPLIPFSTLSPKDIVIVPAFGTTVEIQKELSEIGIDPYFYDTTCPFVEKVWKRAADLGKQGFTVIVHGKSSHEETRATFSHSKVSSPTLIVLDIEETQFLVNFIKGRVPLQNFIETFQGRMSPDFDPREDLKRIGVVNQTTMLASETKEIAAKLRQAMLDLYGSKQITEHFADTRDTLCYATYENQSATRALIESGADLAIVVGGYNSSNTSHLVELCQERFPTYYICGAEEIKDQNTIHHFNLNSKKIIQTSPWLPQQTNKPLEIALTSGASCPDILVDRVIERVSNFFEKSCTPEEAFLPFASNS